MSINIGVVKKAPKPVPKAGGLWVEKCGSKAWSVASIEIVGGWPVFMFSKHGCNTHFLTS